MFFNILKLFLQRENITKGKWKENEEYGQKDRKAK